VTYFSTGVVGLCFRSGGQRVCSAGIGPDGPGVGGGGGGDAARPRRHPGGPQHGALGAVGSESGGHFSPRLNAFCHFIPLLIWPLPTPIFIYDAPHRILLVKDNSKPES